MADSVLHKSPDLRKKSPVNDSLPPVYPPTHREFNTIGSDAGDMRYFSSCGTRGNVSRVYGCGGTSRIINGANFRRRKCPLANTFLIFAGLRSKTNRISRLPLKPVSTGQFGGWLHGFCLAPARQISRNCRLMRNEGIADLMKSRGRENASLKETSRRLSYHCYPFKIRSPHCKKFGIKLNNMFRMFRFVHYDFFINLTQDKNVNK